MGWIWILLVAAAASGLVVLFGKRTRSGDSTGMPTELHPHSHDEPAESVAQSLDTPRHGESAIDEAEEYRDMRRTLGDG